MPVRPLEAAGAARRAAGAGERAGGHPRHSKEERCALKSGEFTSILFNSIQFWSFIGSKRGYRGLRWALNSCGKTNEPSNMPSRASPPTEVTHEVDVPCFAPRMLADFGAESGPRTRR